MFENEITKIQGARMTLEQQMMALENAAMNMQTFAAMDEGKSALKAARKGMDADQIGDTMDDIREEMDEADAIATALGQPLDDALEGTSMRLYACSRLCTRGRAFSLFMHGHQ